MPAAVGILGIGWSGLPGSPDTMARTGGWTMVKYTPKVGDHVRPVRDNEHAREYCRRWKVPDSFIITKIHTKYDCVEWDPGEASYCPGLKAKWVELDEGPW